MSSLPKRPKSRISNGGGAPRGNRNAFKAGRHVAKVRALRARVRLFVRQAHRALAPAPGAKASREI